AQAPFRPQESINDLVRRSELPADKQQIAQVLLTSVKPRPPARWEVEPAVERRRRVEGQVQQIGWAPFNYASNQANVLEYDKSAQRWRFKPDLLQQVTKVGYLDASLLKDPFGRTWTLDDLARMEKAFTPDRLAEAVTQSRMQQLMWLVANYTQGNAKKYQKDGKWDLPAAVLAEAIRGRRFPEQLLKDAWGEPIKLVKRDQKQDHQTGLAQFDYHELVSAGPDRKFGTDDDVRPAPSNHPFM